MSTVSRASSVVVSSGPVILSTFYLTHGSYVVMTGCVVLLRSLSATVKLTVNAFHLLHYSDKAKHFYTLAKQQNHSLASVPHYCIKALC